jgi:LPXTG-motif cell wall-anchored protein
LANYKTAANNSNLIAVGTSSTSVDYENALETAKSLLTEKNTDGSTSNTKKVVILINNASTALDSNGLSSAGAVLADMNEDLDFFFAVNTDGENTDTNLDELIKAYAPASAVTGVFAYSDAAISDTTGTATTVEDKIVSLVSNKLTGIYTSNVSITDILSDYAEWVDGSDIEIKITDSDNEPVAVTKVSTEDDGSETDVIQSQSWKLGQCTITAKLVKVVENNVTKREIKLEFPKEYQLPTGYTFSVTVQIEPTAAAYQYFDETHTTYPNIGDPGTDDSTVTVKTSSEKAGFSSNEEATVTYKNGDADPDTKKYAMPVIQISKAYSWQLFKVSASQFSLDQYVPLSSAEFELTSDSGTQTYYGMSLSSGEVHWYLTHKLNADDEVTCLEPGTYTLTEKKAPTGYLLSNQEWKVTVDGQNHLTVENADSISNIATEEKTTYATDSSPEIVKYNIYYKDEIFYELPSAGGTGIFLYLIAGMLLMMGGALLIFAKRRKVLRI